MSGNAVSQSVSLYTAPDIIDEESLLGHPALAGKPGSKFHAHVYTHQTQSTHPGTPGTSTANNPLPLFLS